MSTNRPSTSNYAAQQQGNNGMQSANWQPPDKRKPLHKSLYLWGGILLAFIIVFGGSIAAFLKLKQAPAATPVQNTIVGHAFFVNSGQISLSSNAGIADQMQISLQNISPPTAGKSYYVWLLSDSKTQALPLLLGTLPVQNGAATLAYPGDSHHTDILASYSRFLVTEENASTPPVNYTLDKSAWIFGAAFSETPNPLDTLEHFSLLDHLRHLLAQDPKLKAVGLVGGLDICSLETQRSCWNGLAVPEIQMILLLNSGSLYASWTTLMDRSLCVQSICLKGWQRSRLTRL
jgi:hypothetical protein